MLRSRLLNLLALTGLAVAWVELDPSLVPQISQPLPIYSLGSPSFIPDDWLKGIIGNTASGAQYTKRHNGDPRQDPPLSLCRSDPSADENGPNWTPQVRFLCGRKRKFWHAGPIFCAAKQP